MKNVKAVQGEVGLEQVAKGAEKEGCSRGPWMSAGAAIEQKVLVILSPQLFSYLPPVSCFPPIELPFQLLLQLSN